MNGIQAIQSALGATQWLLTMVIEDLSDAELLERPVPGANQIAWQIGHVIAGEIMLGQAQLPQAVYPPLPAGWGDLYGQGGASKDGADGFRPKAEYVRMFNEVRKATIEAVGKLQDSDLDRP